MAKLTWYSKLETDSTYHDIDSIFAGTYTGAKAITVSTKIWNNRWGTKDENDLKNFTVKIFFENDEDNSLLKYITVLYNGTQEVPINIVNNYAIVDFIGNVTISGKKNNGIESENRNNYITLDLKFDPNGAESLKPDDLKNLYLEIIDK